MQVSKKQIQEYIQSEGSCCLFCQSKDISAGYVDLDGEYGLQSVNCPHCKSDWIDVYKLEGVESEDSEITSKEEENYLKNEGGICVFCQSKDITTTSSIDIDGIWGTLNVICEECEEEWTDYYKLVDVNT